MALARIVTIIRFVDLHTLDFAAHRFKQQFHIVPNLAFCRRIAKQIRGMIGDDDAAATKFEKLAPHTADRILRLKQCFGGDTAKAANEFRL